MAVIWSKRVKDDLYEVRSAGNTRRLYTNNVFHSHYNANHTLTNSIWDLLLLPALFQPQNSIQRILMMGVGGGTLIKLLHSYTSPKEIIGIEINPVHLSVAKKYFNVSPNEARLICADAIHWIREYRGPAFDMIVDDMFGHTDGYIHRPMALNTHWLSILNQNLNKNGVLVINTTENDTLKNSAYFSNKKVNNFFEIVYSLEHPLCDNKVGVFFKTLRLKKHLMQNIHDIKNKKQKTALLSMDYKIEKIG